MSILGGDQAEQYEAFWALAITLDRDELNQVLTISDSELGKHIANLMTSEDDSAANAFKNGIAMLKLTAFYLNELHKLFPSLPLSREEKKP